MAWINRKPFEDNKKKFNRWKTKNYNKQKKTKSIGSKYCYDTVYNTSKWKKLRQEKLMNNPLCERCLKEGRVTPALDVHHRIPILTDESKAFEYDNLMSLCRSCHIKEHEELRKKK